MTKRKNVWIVNYYSLPPEYAGNMRHIEFSRNLQEKGYDVTILSAGYLRREDRDLIAGKMKYKEETYGKIKYILFKVRHYHGNGLNRMISIIQFAWRVFLYSRRFEKPDIILHNIHAPFDYPILWCAQQLKAKYIAEAWDQWPDSFVRFNLISKNNPLVKISYEIERLMYEKAERIIFSFEGGVDYLRKQKWTNEFGGKIDVNKIYYINNGINIEEFNINKGKYIIDDKDLNNPDMFKIVYLGSINLVNDLKKLIDAAYILKKKTKLVFLIYGNGAERKYLEQYCAENNIHNVIFKNTWVPLKYVPYIISHSSLNIMNYQKDFGTYGISSGKFFQYLAAGKPICANIKMNYCLIDKNNLGIAKDLDTPEEYAKAISDLANLSREEYDNICQNVNRVKLQFDYTVLSEKLFEVLESM